MKEHSSTTVVQRANFNLKTKSQKQKFTTQNLSNYVQLTFLSHSPFSVILELISNLVDLFPGIALPVSETIVLQQNQVS